MNDWATRNTAGGRGEGKIASDHGTFPASLTQILDAFFYMKELVPRSNSNTSTVRIWVTCMLERMPLVDVGAPYRISL